MKKYPRSFLLSIYKKLYLVRRAEELIVRHYGENEMKTPMHMSMGEEAIVVGVCAALDREDQVFGTYRSHGLYLAKTGETEKFFAELYGKVTGCSRGKAGSMHMALPEKGMILTSAVVGTTIPVAVGAALANVYKGNKRIVAVFFGDGAINEGVFWESLNFACLKRLPILFVCEDNNFAIHSPVKERIGYKEIVQVVSQFYCHTAKTRSTDAFEIYKITKILLDKIKRTRMPGFLHAKYYRYLEHVGVQEDFHFGYRDRREFLRWKKIDPIVVARNRLLGAGISSNAINAIEQKIDAVLKNSLDKARKAPYPDKKELMLHVYAS
jgi:TPP-dependent pyruvate/acetoin dehydrogenase alpha subunit